MNILHKLVLYGLLGLVGVSLLLPGLMEMLKLQPGSPGLTPATLDAKNQFRALQGMMAAVGMLALWACVELEHARVLVLALGIIMLATVVARVYSLSVDGLPGAMTLVYLVVETLLAVAFLIWPPPH